jgi:probable HAF family extracellular repeat protein
MIDLGTLGGSGSSAVDVNESGQVVGTSVLDDEPYSFYFSHAFSWTQAGGMIDLGTLGTGYSYALAVSDSGQVVGGSTTADGVEHAFSWTSEGGMIDLGTGCRPCESFAVAVNDRSIVDLRFPPVVHFRPGQVVGRLGRGPFHAFSWSEETGMVDLGTLGGDLSDASDLNSRGEVVGFADLDLNHSHAFLWTSAGGMVDLGTLGGSESSARYINENGWVVGGSTNVAGQSHAALWLPAGGDVLPGG